MKFKFTKQVTYIENDACIMICAYLNAMPHSHYNDVQMHIQMIYKCNCKQFIKNVLFNCKHVLLFKPKVTSFSWWFLVRKYKHRSASFHLHYVIIYQIAITYHCRMNHLTRIWNLSYLRAAKAQARLRKRTVSPEPSLLTYTKYESR